VAITHVGQQEEMARQRRAERLAQQQEQRPGLTAEGSSLVPGARRQVPEAGDGQTPIPSGALFGSGGNMLKGWALDVPDGEMTSMRVVFTCPGLVGGCTLDFGDETEHEFNSLGGSVEHEYPALSAGASSIVYDAVCRDEHQRLRGWIRFRLPHHRTLPQDLRSMHPASLIV
jgi:hypothetical protein